MQGELNILPNNRNQTAPIFAENQMAPIDVKPIPVALINEASSPLPQARRSVMTAPFGHNRRARMFAAGFGQARNKPRQIEDVHAFGK